MVAAMSKTSVCSKTAPATSMTLSSVFQSNLPGLYSIPLKFISIVKDAVTELEESITFRTVAMEEMKTTSHDTAASIVFVVRRPGCVLCREHGQQLVELVKQQKNQSVALWGTIKEVGVDDAGLIEFHNTYFPYPLYRDVNLSIYKAFGSRKISLSTWNPFRLYRGYKELNQRLNNKNLTGNLKGEGFIQGGILLLDRTGEVKYAFEESVGKELFLPDIQTALDKMLTSTKSITAAGTGSPEL